MAKQPTTPNRAEAAALLQSLWDVVLSQDEAYKSTPEIAALVNSELTAIRFCLPTQLLGKFTDNDLDALCLQRGKDAEDASRWDPRGFATQTVVPWNRRNQNVLGPSGDPYVSNPLRRSRLDHGLDQMADREQWEALCAVLQDVENNSDTKHTKQIFLQTLAAIRDRLKELTFVYVVPARVSLKQAETLVEQFLADKSGGDRGLAVAAALFETVRKTLKLYKEIKRGVINASDAATKSAGDLECIAADGHIALAVEIKERKITLDDVQAAIVKAREFKVNEIIFCSGGLVEGARDEIEKLFANAWASGTNIYQMTIYDLIRAVLPLFGETGIRMFIDTIGAQLDAFSTQPKHRKVWTTLLDGL
jgi:SacI restriction endonuclease